MRKSKEQKEWIISNFKYCHGNTKKLVDAFNIIFDTEITNTDVRTFLRFVGLLGKKEFTEEQKQFLIKNRKFSSKEISKMFYLKFGIEVSADWVRRKLFELGASKEYCKYIYTKNFGEIPKGYTVIHLDSNELNNEIDNLFLIPQKHVKLMKKNKWFFENPDMTMVCIKYLDLFYKLKEARNNQ